MMNLFDRKKAVLCLFLVIIFSTPALVQANESSQLLDIINSQHRSESNKQRDIYRHPLQTLTFFQIKPEMTVIEIWPGKGWYTEILAPYLKNGGGQFIAAGFPQHAGPQWRQDMQADYKAWLTTSPGIYDQVNIVELGPPSYWTIGPENSVDAVLTFRNVHNWLKGDYATEMFNAFYRVLKPGGILGVTDHRAAIDTDLATMKTSGYLDQNLVIDLAKQAGFVLDETSEINANPRDAKDYAKGVWTLPPTLRLGEQDREHYLSVGESDRMTLRFRKLK
ncbi:MAG: methyltransferase [Pseudomonadota bacterium]|nr:methyltransferase [Pseudomonadota bacterium]